MASGSSDGSKDNADIPRGLINRMGNPIGRGSRLPSVRGHRDLTLGGKQRKVFTPNLSTVKKGSSKNDPSKQAETSSPSDQSPSSAKGTGRGGRGKFERGRGRGRGRGEDRTIQLQSEFAYGPMGGQTSGGWSRGTGAGGGGSSRRNEESAAVKIVRQNHGFLDEKKLSDSLMRDDFLTDVSSGEPHMKPIRLPLNCVNLMKQEVKAELKEEIMETSEKIETDGDGNAIKFECDKKENITKHKKYTEPPPTVSDVLNDAKKSERGELVFIQFPDTLPGCPLETDDKTSKEDELCQKLNLCQLKGCTEGFVGKLRIRKSGKAELVLGENVMQVLPGLPVNFQQELVSIRTDSDPGQMVVLGQVNHKLIVTPDYDSLLMETNRF